jgi:hypothetical protein
MSHSTLPPSSISFILATSGEPVVTTLIPVAAVNGSNSAETCASVYPPPQVETMTWPEPFSVSAGSAARAAASPRASVPAEASHAILAAFETEPRPTDMIETLPSVARSRPRPSGAILRPSASPSTNPAHERRLDAELREVSFTLNSSLSGRQGGMRRGHDDQDRR